MRCSHCGHELGAKSPRPGEVQACPRCGSGVPSIGVEPLPPAAGQSVIPAWFDRALNVGCGTIVLGVIAASAVFVATGLVSPRTPDSRLSCASHMKEIGRALHLYHDTYSTLPAQSVTDKNGRPMHSWRVALLPFIEQKKLYDSYDFNQPWDSDANRTAREAYIETYCCPASRSDDGKHFTTYFVVYGDETMFAPNEWRTLNDVTDGTANTIMVVECDSPEFRVEWSEPRDIPFDLMNFRIDPPEGQGLGSEHDHGINVAFGDGHVRFLKSKEIDEATFRYLLIRNDGEEVQLP